MSKPDEFAEHMEHAAHSGHHDSGGEAKQLNRHIGVTMACLGILMAIVATFEGHDHTRMLTTLSLQTDALVRAQSAATNCRLGMLDLLQLDALGRDRTSPAFKSISDQVLLFRRRHQALAAWTKDFKEPLQALAEGIERYVRAEFTLQTAMVMASLALLFSNRRLWLLALVIGCAGCLFTVHAKLSIDRALARSSVNLTMTQEEYERIVQAQHEAEVDERILKSLGITDAH